MIASHTHPHFKEDNSKVYYYIHEATRTTSYDASIKPYHKYNNVLDTFLTLVSKYVGGDK